MWLPGSDFQSALKGLEAALSKNADVEAAAQAVRAAIDSRLQLGVLFPDMYSDA